MSAADPPSTKTPFRQGDVVKGHYVLGPEVGAGSFGQIFSASTSTGGVRTAALKFEHMLATQPQLMNEAVVMRAMTGNKHFAKFYHHGTHRNYKFVAMELLGPSLIDVVNRKPPYRFSLHSILKIGVQGTEALMALHQAGFVHRDIKPGNLSIGNSQETAGIVYLIDFGLCKRLQTADSINSETPLNSNFRGTLRYASLRTHHGFDLGRSDDLISLLYVMIELRTGKLPWTSLKTKEEVCRMKERYLGKELVSSMPKQFEKIEEHLFTLDFFAEPDYFMIAKLMKEAAVENGLDLKQPFEWEIEMDELREDVKNQSKPDFTHTLLTQNRLQVVERLTSQSLMKQIIEDAEVQQRQKKLRSSINIPGVLPIQVQSPVLSQVIIEDIATIITTIVTITVEIHSVANTAAIIESAQAVYQTEFYIQKSCISTSPTDHARK
ncbi:MAG: putative Tau-tubulin kinase 1 [Streblomastix strix]|uniref:Putative Tau-tubulin kinase 1 n=1 Tax=Streblomastix strix TaxID=222440 RepID=A0A5J4WHD2_9EUKA|nr:MAG: putative Tau-tubulin kinase 1 [Streblomastix strix]